MSLKWNGKILILLCIVCSIEVKISALQREDIVISEEFLSPDWEKYDCHSCSLVETSIGKILAVWKGGFGEGKSNLDIVSRVGVWQSNLDGTELKMIHFEEESVVWNPVLAKLSAKEILLFYRVGNAPWASLAFVKRSFDAGQNWTDPEILPAGIVGPTKNKPFVLENGTLLCPSSTQVGSSEGKYRATAVWIDSTEDGGKTWCKSGPLTTPEQPFGAIEPALFMDQHGNLRLLCRDRALKAGRTNGCIWMATSFDFGKTWSPLEKTDLPNPDSALDVADLGKGVLVLIYNHSAHERFPLSIATSLDGGVNWERKCDLEKETGEFPAVIVSRDGVIHVTYAYQVESGQRRIKHVAIDQVALFERH